jgi:hypothetical protein
MTRHPGYSVSQRKRKRTEERLGWLKTITLLRKGAASWSLESGLDLYSRLRRLQSGAHAESGHGRSGELSPRLSVSSRTSSYTTSSPTTPVNPLNSRPMRNRRKTALPVVFSSASFRCILRGFVPQTKRSNESQFFGQTWHKRISSVRRNRMIGGNLSQALDAFRMTKKLLSPVCCRRRRMRSPTRIRE